MLLFEREYQTVADLKHRKRKAQHRSSHEVGKKQREGNLINRFERTSAKIHGGFFKSDIRLLEASVGGAHHVRKTADRIGCNQKRYRSDSRIERRRRECRHIKIGRAS